MDLLRRANDRIAIGIVAHSGKSDVDIRGSSSLEDDLDIVWRVKRDDEESDDAITVELSKRKDGPEGIKHELRPSPITGTGSIVLTAARGQSEKPPERHLDVLKLLARAGDAGESKTSLKEALKIGLTTLYKITDWLEDKGWIARTARGQQRVWKITVSGLSRLQEIEEMPK